MLHRPRQEFILARLRAADGISYDDLCGAVVAAFPEPVGWLASVRGVREVRWALWHGLVITEPDESVWLTETGWAASDAWQRLTAAVTL